MDNFDRLERLWEAALQRRYEDFYDNEPPELRVEIRQAEYAENPREVYDHTAILACVKHRNYRLGDTNISSFEEEISKYPGYEQFEEELDEADGLYDLISIAEKLKIPFLPIYMYEHSGIAINTMPFSCRWDSGMIGIAYIPLETLKKGSYVKEHALEIMEAEVKEYSQYMSGEVYTIAIYKGNEELYSSYEFYGDNLEDVGVLEDIRSQLGNEYNIEWKPNCDLTISYK